MQRWKFSALAAAVLAAAGSYSTDASALALGRINVQSVLGEPLRAEIELPQITPAEADSLRATIASPEVFRAQGMEYTQAINNLQVELQRRPDGTTMLRLSGERPVSDLFLDLVLDARWGSGHIVRNYTMLFDPSSARRAAPAVTAAAQMAAGQSAASDATPAQPRTDEDAMTPAAATRLAPADGVTVRAGDTAGRIANAYRPAGVSLDQMLVALVHSNPDAFIRGNANLLKAGAVLQIPDQATAQATPASEARQILAAQARDFNAFRNKLATAVPATGIAAAQRSATGNVQTRVEDRRATTTAPDKLTLSKGAVKGRKTAEEQLAKDKQAHETTTRMAELSKNITELNQLGAASTAGAAPAAAASAPAAVVVQAPAVPATPVAPPDPPTPPPEPAPAPPQNPRPRPLPPSPPKIPASCQPSWRIRCCP
ncbi:type IV pilus assembly protein FimV [Verminephrobacter aporrectodeae]|uniref:type IV pilus assembly protein FimV n=1 Tax=Verminephrobacter aporrectodeae TaxID=1110389 RepID=UPI002AA2B18B|nr:FimV/HubP family polar landmark protein [Verminephrobacter aporrectodeae]